MVLTWLAACCGPVCLGADPTAIDVGLRRELFVESSLIDTLTGEVDLRLHHPVAREVAIVHDAPWEGSGSMYHTVFQDGDRYRMYYRGSNLEVTEGRLRNTHPPLACYAESDDGIQWRKPLLGLVEFAGSTSNNIVWQGRGTHNFAPFKDQNPKCAPEARYKALGGVKQGGLFAFQSPDGLRWSLMRDTPVITDGAFDSQNLAFWDPMRGKYRAYWRVFVENATDGESAKAVSHRAVRTAESDDFLHWADGEELTYVDSPRENLYTNQIKPYPRAPQLWIGFPTRYVDRGWSAPLKELPDLANRELRASAGQRYGTAITEALLMASRDGVRFQRWNEAFLRPGIQRPGSWQYGHQYVANHLVETASSLPGAPRELSLYATENWWHGTGATVRRYTLRLDGFVSVHASMKGGQVTTKPLVFAGSRLRLNYATSAAGSLRVEIQDANGAAIEGFALQDCPPHFGDAVDGLVNFRDGPALSALAGKAVRLRFELKDADLYAFRFERPTSP